MGIKVSARSKVYCVFGDPIEHSFSPALHNRAFDRMDYDAVYVAFKANEETIGDAIAAMRVLGISGASVTMPNKMACMGHLDEIDPTAKLIGSVNALVNTDGYIKGYNTDGFGCVSSFEHMGVQVKGGKMVLLGLGGAGGAVALTAAYESGLAELSVFNRANGKSWNHAQEAVDLINKETGCKATLLDLNNKDLLREEIASANMLMNTTNVGMGNSVGQSVIPDASYFHKDLVVQDAIYSPAKTKLLELAEEAGCKCTNGIAMLFYQGAKQFELWTGQKMPLSVEEFHLG